MPLGIEAGQVTLYRGSCTGSTAGRHRLMSIFCRRIGSSIRLYKHVVLISDLMWFFGWDLTDLMRLLLPASCWCLSVYPWGIKSDLPELTLQCEWVYNVTTAPCGLSVNAYLSINIDLHWCIHSADFRPYCPVTPAGIKPLTWGRNHTEACWTNRVISISQSRVSQQSNLDGTFSYVIILILLCLNGILAYLWFCLCSCKITVSCTSAYSGHGFSCSLLEHP